MATIIQYLQNILAQKDPSLGNETKRIVLKEVLQAYALDFLYNHSSYRKLNFYGGTCLHMIYGLNRLSEDIDLDNSSEVDLRSLEVDLLSYFRSIIGFSEVTAKTQIGEWGIRRTTLKFLILNDLGLSSHMNETLHLKVEVSQHQQVSIIQKTPILIHGRSLVAAHFSMETMMAGKMLACLERNFQRGKNGASIKGRDFYDLLWFMQKKIQPLEEKLNKEGTQPYTTQTAMKALRKKIFEIKTSDLAIDLLPLFEQRTFIDAWLESFHENFALYITNYLKNGIDDN